MKKVMVFVLFSLIIAGCQKQKEEPKAMPQLPSGPIMAQDTLKLAQEAVKADPKNLNAWIQLGNMTMDMSRFNEAIDAYQKALELDPKNVDVRVDMGTCYKNIGKPDVAVKEYRKALEINPNHPYGHMNLAVVLSGDLKNRAEAIKEFEKYLQVAPNAPNAEQVRQEIQKLKAAR
jgi:tetratricopeptide (TPR) repeat protein